MHSLRIQPDLSPILKLSLIQSNRSVASFGSSLSLAKSVKQTCPGGCHLEVGEFKGRAQKSGTFRFFTKIFGFFLAIDSSFLAAPEGCRVPYSQLIT
jgi:hypothetical protein